MTHNQSGRRSIVSRVLAATILTGIYCLGLVGATALVVGASTTSAQAQRGDGRGRGRGRGDVRGRGRGRGDVRGRGRGRGNGCVINGAGFRVCF